MGLFFDDPKKGLPKTIPKPRGFFEEIIIMVLSWIGWALKHLLDGYVNLIKYSWTRGDESDGRVSKLGKLFAVALVVIPCFLIYKIPFVRDMTLSKGVTVNLSQGEPIYFPDRKFFAIDEDERKTFQLEQNSSATYITYSRELEEKILVMEKGYCQLIPRGKSVAVISSDIPIYAIGFEDTVSYKKNNNSQFLSGLHRYVPPLIDLTYISRPWYEFRNDWWDMAMEGSRRFPFIIKVRNNENAMICF